MRKVPLNWENRACLRAIPCQLERHGSDEAYRCPPPDRDIGRRDRDHLPGRHGAAADAASHRAGPRAVTGAGRWRVLRAVHDRGKIIADLAVAVALGGDFLADIAMLRSQPELTGPVASDPVVSRLVTALAEDTPQGAQDDSRGAARGLGAGLAAGRGRHARHGRRAGHRRSGRDAGDRVLRGGARLARARPPGRP
jgi:hypothetical protein